MIKRYLNGHSKIVVSGLTVEELDRKEELFYKEHDNNDDCLASGSYGDPNEVIANNKWFAKKVEIDNSFDEYIYKTNSKEEEQWNTSLDDAPCISSNEEYELFMERAQSAMENESPEC